MHDCGLRATEICSDRVSSTFLLPANSGAGVYQSFKRWYGPIKDPGRYIPSIFLLDSWGSVCGIPI